MVYILFFFILGTLISNLIGFKGISRPTCFIIPFAIISVIITFIDNGVPYDPLAKADPDITLSTEEREIGGLGIYMVKKSMDDIVYEYKDGQNILSIKKKLN